jgi:hypothetical protein
MNLSSGDKQNYTCTPREAVIAAYAQSEMDWNTWQYAERYNSLVEEGEHTFLCGDFSVFKDGRNF